MEYRSHSIRLGDDVWDALQASEFSANQILRRALLGVPVFEERTVDVGDGEMVTVSVAQPWKGPLLKPKDRR